MRISDWSSDVCSSDLKAHAESIGGLFVRVNVSDEASVEAGLAAAEAAHGVARILVNCAGLAPAIKTVGRDNTPHPMDVYRKVVEVNLIGTFTMISRFAAKLVAADPIGEERGVIINTASVTASDGQLDRKCAGRGKGGAVSVNIEG